MHNSVQIREIFFFHSPKYKENKQFLNLDYDIGPIHLRWSNTETIDQLIQPQNIVKKLKYLMKGG